MIVSSKGAQETDVRSPKKSCHAAGFVMTGRKADDDVIKEGEGNDERNIFDTIRKKKRSE